MIQEHNEQEHTQLNQLQLLRNRVPPQGPTNPPTHAPTNPPTNPPTKAPTTTAPTPLPANPMNWRRQDPNQKRVEEETAKRRMQQQQQHQESTSRKKEQEDEKKKTMREAADDDRLNILFLYADDWTMKVLGKLNAQVHTPNLDRMAEKGMLFVNN
eukprot:CAMPEP_0170863996 /NCGR_PEP_ID=MMETSP0734-20130129/20155_1 /TAXON_ID=186038 /ORGANISM="Fragilariopsis kerguelensis, Strain L26-C5" /LENGTH=155 /DNA_ID=CAMNT_0011239401 /DNA_START=554 /DNA_END=1021 /DNA_ORIENTATION=+